MYIYTIACVYPFYNYIFQLVSDSEQEAIASKDDDNIGLAVELCVRVVKNDMYNMNL